VQPSKYSGLTDGNGGDTIYLSVIDRDGNIVSLIQSCIRRSAAASSRRHGRDAAQPRRAVHDGDGHPNQIAPRKRPLHTIIPAFMEKGDVKIGFGIMGGFNQAQATRSSCPTSRISARRAGTRRGWTFNTVFPGFRTRQTHFCLFILFIFPPPPHTQRPAPHFPIIFSDPRLQPPPLVQFGYSFRALE
jgi:hypothetical protein